MQTDKRLIDANDAINTIKAKARNEVMALKSVLSLIESAPAYDAVPVVRCGDCVHSKEENWIDSDCRLCMFWGRIMECDGFCHKGAKMDIPSP